MSVTTPLHPLRPVKRTSQGLYRNKKAEAAVVAAPPLVADRRAEEDTVEPRWDCQQKSTNVTTVPPSSLNGI